MLESSANSHKPASASPVVQNNLSVCADLIGHMQNGGTLTDLDFGLLIGTTTSMELLLRNWERQKLVVSETHNQSELNDAALP